MFRGKESSNRIELSQLLQDLLNFGVLGSLQLWGWVGGWMGVGVVGWGWGVGGWGWVVVLGCPQHTCTCTHTHACTRMHGKHDNFMQMATPIWGNTWEFPMMSYVCACMHMHVHMGGVHPLTTPYPIHPPPTPQGDPRNHSKFNST